MMKKSTKQLSALLALLVFGMLGCAPSNEGSTANGGIAANGGSAANYRYLPIKTMDGMANNRADYLAVVPVFKNEDLELIVGKSPTDQEWVDDICGFSSNGDIVWTLDFKCGEKNPRPYAGKNKDKNDRKVAFETITNIGDLDGDGTDDLFASENVSQAQQHSAIISGADGKVIVQSQLASESSLIKPNDVVDFDGDGTSDLRFFYKRPNAFKVLTISGVDLSVIDESTTQADKSSVAIAGDMPDETGDGFREFLIATGPFHGEGPMTDRVMLVIDGKTLKTIRSTFEAKADNVTRNVRIRSMGDVNGDGTGDYLKFHHSSARSNKSNGFLAAYDGVSGKEIWYLDGTEIGGPIRELRSSPEPNKNNAVGKQTHNFLGKYAAIVPDQNSDSVRDLVVSVAIDADTPDQRTAMLISGIDGSILAKKTLPGAIVKSNVIPLVSPNASDGNLVVGLPGFSGTENFGLIEVTF